MRFKTLLAAIVVLSRVTSAKAVSLVIMAVNTTALPGDKVYDVGIQVTAADVAAGGPNPVLLVQNLTFTGVSAGPIQAAGK